MKGPRIDLFYRKLNLQLLVLLLRTIKKKEFLLFLTRSRFLGDIPLERGRVKPKVKARSLGPISSGRDT